MMMQLFSNPFSEQRFGMSGPTSCTPVHLSDGTSINIRSASANHHVLKHSLAADNGEIEQ